jgi:ribosomal protein L37AE/L43A
MSHIQCNKCGEHVATKRHVLGYKTCLSCGEHEARQRKHCVAPMHKSNYMLFTRLEDLVGINNKGGIVK